MLCRACRLGAGVVPAQRRLLHRVQGPSLSATASSRVPSARVAALPQPRTPPTVRSRYFSTSTALSSSAEAQGPSPAPAPGPAPALQKPSFLSEGESRVWDRLVAELAPTQLLVQDISGGCGSMYGIEISSEKFRGLNMLKQQRLVNAALADLMKDWHGVQLKTRVP